MDKDKHIVSTSERVTAVFGEDITKAPKLSKMIYSDVLQELAAERAEVAKKTAKGILQKLAELETKHSHLAREFQKSSKAIEKEKIKILQQVEAGLKGVEPPPEDEDKKDG